MSTESDNDDALSLDQWSDDCGILTNSSLAAVIRSRKFLEAAEVEIQRTCEDPEGFSNGEIG